MSAWGNEHQVSVSVEPEEEVDASRANGTASSTSRVLLKYYVIKPAYSAPKQRTGETTLGSGSRARIASRCVIRSENSCAPRRVQARMYSIDPSVPRKRLTTRSLTLSHLLTASLAVATPCGGEDATRDSDPPNSQEYMVAVFLFTIIIGCTLVTSRQEMSSDERQIDFPNLSAACNDFTISLYKHLSISSGDNIVTSPLSLHMLLSLLLNGAGGSTLDELQMALHHDTVSSNDGFKALIPLLNNLENVHLHIANAVYVQDGFPLMTDFLSICANIFQSLITSVDFRDNAGAVKSMNSWVGERTNNKISDAISSDDINEHTRVVLINAIYFKSNWQYTFDEKHTTKREFYVSKTETNLVPTMFKKSMYAHGEIPTWNTKYIEIPYTNQNIVMIILLPDREIELQTLESKFNWNILTNAPKSVEQVELYLPKFKFEITVDLESILRKMGLNSMFEDGADFTRLSDVPLKMSRALQKVFVEVNEKGSEAAAATVAAIRVKRAIFLPETMKFAVDRPFMFAIEYKPSRMPLFLGSVRKIESLQERDEL